MEPTNLYPVASRTLSAWIFRHDPLLVATVTLAAERLWICPSTIVMLPLRTQSMYPGGSTCKAPDKAFARGWLGIVCGRSCWLLDLIKSSEIILNICLVDHFPNEDSAMKRWNRSGCSANGNHAACTYQHNLTMLQATQYRSLPRSARIADFQTVSTFGPFSSAIASAVCDRPKLFEDFHGPQYAIVL